MFSARSETPRNETMRPMMEQMPEVPFEGGGQAGGAGGGQAGGSGHRVPNDEKIMFIANQMRSIGSDHNQMVMLDQAMHFYELFMDQHQDTMAPHRYREMQQYLKRVVRNLANGRDDNYSDPKANESTLKLADHLQNEMLSILKYDAPRQRAAHQGVQDLPPKLGAESIAREVSKKEQELYPKLRNSKSWNEVTATSNYEQGDIQAELLHMNSQLKHLIFERQLWVDDGSPLWKSKIDGFTRRIESLQYKLHQQQLEYHGSRNKNMSLGRVDESEEFRPSSMRLRGGSRTKGGGATAAIVNRADQVGMTKDEITALRKRPGAVQRAIISILEDRKHYGSPGDADSWLKKSDQAILRERKTHVREDRRPANEAVVKSSLTEDSSDAIRKKFGIRAEGLMDLWYNHGLMTPVSGKSAGLFEGQQTVQFFIDTILDALGLELDSKLPENVRSVMTNPKPTLRQWLMYAVRADGRGGFPTGDYEVGDISDRAVVRLISAGSRTKKTTPNGKIIKLFRALQNITDQESGQRLLTHYYETEDADGGEFDPIDPLELFQYRSLQYHNATLTLNRTIAKRRGFLASPFGQQFSHSGEFPRQEAQRTLTPFIQASTNFLNAAFLNQDINIQLKKVKSSPLLQNFNKTWDCLTKFFGVNVEGPVVPKEGEEKTTVLGMGIERAVVGVTGYSDNQKKQLWTAIVKHFKRLVRFSGAKQGEDGLTRAFHEAKTRSFPTPSRSVERPPRPRPSGKRKRKRSLSRQYDSEEEEEEEESEEDELDSQEDESQELPGVPEYDEAQN